MNTEELNECPMARCHSPNVAFVDTPITGSEATFAGVKCHNCLFTVSGFVTKDFAARVWNAIETISVYSRA